MERGKSGPGRGKAKAQHFPSDLFVLGSKSSGNDASKRPIPTGSGDRKREGPPMQGGLPIIKKPKIPIATTSGLIRPGPAPIASTTVSSLSTGIEAWESQAIDVEPADLVSTVLDYYQASQSDKAGNVICGAAKTLKSTKWKPDSVLTVGLVYLAKLRPSLFSLENVTQALSSLLKRDPQHNFKAKGNPTVAVLAANLLARGYNDSKHWPTTFVKLYVEDAMAERVWVDQTECKGFVNNILTGFGTKQAPANIQLLVPEIGPLGLNRSDSPLTIALDDEDDAGTSNSNLDILPTMPRFSKTMDVVEQIVADMGQVNRRQTPENVTRNYLKLLSSTAGIQEMRILAASRLEIWLQNPKLMKPAQELLLAVCVNCCTHSTKDIQVIGCLAKIRLKTKGLINFYLACLRELINAHPDNLSALLKHIIFNELSTSRNPNNMPMIGMIFQNQPDKAATLLAEIYLELLLNRDDYLRTLRILLREIARCLRYDINIPSICRGLMADKRDNPNFRDFEFKERMFLSIIDLIAHSCFLAVSPAVKESANLSARGEKREMQTLLTFYELVASIEQETILWLRDVAVKIYRPSAQEFLHSVHKILFLDQLESYYKVDNWPLEAERNLMFRLLVDAPLYENTLLGVILMGLSKEHSITGPDSLEIADQLVRRVASLPSENTLVATRPDIFDLFLKTSVYHHPDNISLPSGYSPPSLAIGTYYWKSWLTLLVLSAHNPETLGMTAWDKYPTLQMFMEMCITNHFSYPTPTMQNDSSDEWKAQEVRLSARDRDAILEFETHLAAASTKQTINETTSLLLPQLIAYDPLGSARKPPQQVLDQLAALNSSHRLGHLLCRSRHPDFLLDLIQRHGTSQSMPWLADLVENSESSLSHLPVQCLCEFLLTSGPPEKQGKGQQLVSHLQHVLTSPQQEPTAPCEVLEYLLRRLSSPHLNSRIQAIKGLKLVLSSSSQEENATNLIDYLKDSSWLLDKLPQLPHFSIMRPQVVTALRQACQVENDPKCIASYIQFLAVNTLKDDLTQMTLLVHDMAQLIVERSTIINAIMPNSLSSEGLRTNTHHALLLIFCGFLQKAREPHRGKYQWSESQDQVLVSWASGEEATLHILVVHAMIILLCHGPTPDEILFKEMLEIWFPTKSELPKGYLVDTSEEALLIPDWLKLKMIRSGNERLVNAALVDLDVPQLLLFIQSFGIPVSSMSRLLETLDSADRNQMAAASFDKPYMRQLVLVQRRRGATGGLKFIQDLGIPEPPPLEAINRNNGSRPALPFSKDSNSSTRTHHQPPAISVPLLINQLFSPLYTPTVRRKALSDLQKILLVDVKTDSEKTQNAALILQHLMTTVKSTESFRELLRVLEDDPNNSCLALRLFWTQLQTLPKSFQSEFASYMVHIRGALTHRNDALIALLDRIGGNNQKVECDVESDDPATLLLKFGKSPRVGQIIDWLVSNEPELISQNSENQMLSLLFSKPVKLENNESTSDIETCRPYLLTLLTHRASWTRLHRIMNLLLLRFDQFYSASAVLDFLEALTRNPRLWQGREKHVPKHHTQEPVLNLTQTQVFVLTQYIAEESEITANCNNDEKIMEQLERRLPLLLESLDEEFFSEIVKNIADASINGPSVRRNIFKQFLILLYFRVPGLIKYLFGTDHERTLKGSCISGWSVSHLDKMSHTILTALTTTNLYPKDWAKRSHDFELAARKMAIMHPSLVLRQLGMLASSLQGRCYLDLKVLRNRNHIAVFSQVLGLIELLEPFIFLKEYLQNLQSILDAFINLFKTHGHVKDVVHMVPKLIAFLQKYLSHDAPSASKFLQSHAEALSSIQRMYPNMSALRSLLSGVLTMMKDDNGDDENNGQSTLVVSTPVDIVTQPPAPILLALAKNQGEDLLPTLQDLDHISSRNPVILEGIHEQIEHLLLSPFSSIRTIANTLVSRLLKHNPQSPVLAGYIRSLETNNGDVTQSALEKLPEIVVSAQEHAVTLLEKAFSLGVRSSMNTSTCISRAISMLNQQSGC